MSKNDSTTEEGRVRRDARATLADHTVRSEQTTGEERTREGKAGERNYESEAERLASAIEAGYRDSTVGFKKGSPAAQAVAQAVQEYAELWDKARMGRILVPSRIRAIVPFLLEIVEELDEIEKEDREFEEALRTQELKEQRETPAETKKINGATETIEAKEGTAPTADAIESRDPYQPITIEQAEALADRIVVQEEDEQISAFLKLLHGLVYASLHRDWPSVEGLVIAAARRAYTRTTHASRSFDEFAALEFKDTRRLRVVTRDELDRLCEPKSQRSGAN